VSPCRWITNPSTLWVIGSVLRKYRRGLRQGSPLPPGGDVAVAREPDDREAFMPGRRPLRVHWLGYRPEPREMGDWLADSAPRLEDLSPDGLCWWWDPEERHWLLVYPSSLNPGDIWLPYWAIADPDAP
jgi:hypothetical protein